MLSDHLFLFRVGYKWITRFLALSCYALLLFPGFIQGLNSVIYNIFHTCNLLFMSRF